VVHSRGARPSSGQAGGRRLQTAGPPLLHWRPGPPLDRLPTAVGMAARRGNGPARAARRASAAARSAAPTVSFDEVALRMPFPLGNLWRLGLNGSAFSWAFSGVVGRSLRTFPFVGERWGTVGQCRNGTDRVILTRSRARTELSGHRCAIRDDQLADYKVCAGTVGDRPAFIKIRLDSFQDFIRGLTRPSSADRTRRRWKRHVALSVSLPRS